MLKDILRFEWRYHTRQPAFFAAAGFFLMMGFAIGATAFGPDNLPVTSPYLVMQSLAFLSLLSVFAVAIFGSSAVLRDGDYRMAEIVYSTPIGKLHYLGGRFAGAFLATVTAFSFSVPGMLIATRMPWLPAERLGPVSLPAYGWAFLIAVVPNILFATAVLFAVAALTRNSVATHVGAVAVYVLYFVSAALTNSPLMAGSKPGAGGGEAAALFDPFALASFFHDTRYWSIARKVTGFVPLGGSMLWNRLLWLAVTAAILVFVHRRFSFRLIARPKKKTTKEMDSPLQAAQAIPYAPVATDFGWRVWIASFRSAVRLELRTLFRSIPLLLLVGLWLVVAGSEVYSAIFAGEYGSRSYPATEMIVAALQQPLTIFGTILLIYYSAEVFWREERSRIASIVDTTPVSSSVMIASKWTALTALIATLTGTAILLGVVMQALAGYQHFQPLVYGSLFYLTALPLVLYTAAALVIHALSPGRYMGMMVSVLFIVLARRVTALGLEHPLWRFGSGPSVSYTELTGFTPTLKVHHWFMLHWSVIALLLLLAAALLWRGIGASLGERFRQMRRNAPRFSAPAAVALILVALLSGGWIFYNTNVAQDYTTGDSLNDWKEEYERTYRHLSSLPQPFITGITLAMDIYPDRGRYRMNGAFEIVNETTQAIPSVWVAVRRDARNPGLSIAGARPSFHDDRFGMFRFDLAEPLAPGAKAKLRFSFDYEGDRFPSAAQDTRVLQNGTYLMSWLMMPSVGYRRSYELTDPRERARRGLPASVADSLEEAGHGDPQSDTHRVSIVSTISTSLDQIALAPGHLEKSWQENGRSYFQYRTENPVSNRFSIASARYSVARSRHEDTAIEIYYHPAHGQNVKKIGEVAAITLDELEEAFGPYQHRELRFAEVALQPFAGFATGGTAWLSDSRLFLVDSRRESPVDLIARRTAHEIAHQWWGYQLTPASGEGASLLVESLTKYSELRVLRRMYGAEMVRRLLEVELDRYLSGRSQELYAEVPLYRAGNQSYLFYSKGLMVTNAIAGLIGEDAFHSALRRLLQEPQPTAHDFLRHVEDASTREQWGLIEQWLKKIVLYDLAVEGATALLRGDGQYEVTVRLRAAKSESDGMGVESPLPFDEMIEVGAFRGNPAVEPVALLQLRRFRLRTEVSEITMLLPERPQYVAVDPYLTRIDKNRFDNDKEVQSFGVRPEK